MHSSTLFRLNQRFVTATSIVAVSLALGGFAHAQPAQDPESGESAGLVEEVVVTGFRRSLAAALDLKRLSVGAVDAIYAEDIADFPDQNLAESLQRIPGVTITRDSGEGRTISVRGLSGEFTRVRVNGIEAIAASGGEGGPNRSRDFDFNVFASELFNNLVVYKTASASLDEGSLGAVVDLNTGRPFNYAEGTTFVVSGQGEYSDVTEDIGPRAAGLYAYHDPDGRWGASVSAAYSDNTTLELGQNTVRWEAAQFRSVAGVNCTDNPSDAGCAEVRGGFIPRIPRYGEIKLERERIGVTGGLQFAPSDATTFTFDALYSQLDASRGEIWGEVLLRGNERFMDVVSYTRDPARNTIDSMTINNAWVRMENFEKAWTTDFTQWGLSADHDFSDSLRGHALVGSSKSELDFPHEITFMYDDRDYNGFVYDYSDDKFPEIAFNGPDVTDPGNFQLTELRDRPSYVEHSLDTIEGDMEWQFSDTLALEFGASYKEFNFDTTGTIRDTTVCGANLYECDSNGDGVDDLVGVPATEGLTDVYHFDDRTGGNSTTRWAVPNLNGWIEYFDLFNLPEVLDLGNVRAVEEKDTALFAQLNGNMGLGSMDLLFDLGVRWVETEQSSTGYNSGAQVTVDREPYDDWLPALNVALFLTEDLVLRFSAAEVMTRPALNNLSPGGSVDAFNYRVSYQNPFLDPTRATAFDTSIEWYFAEESVLSLALFYKDIESRPINTSRTDTYASTGLPLSLLNPTSPAGQCPECIPWTISTIDNGPGGELTGFEIAFQMPFSEVTDMAVLSDFGVIANYTGVDSDVDYTFGSTVITERLFGLSESAYNATLYYERNRFNARASMSYRDDYLTGTSGTGNRFEGYGETTNVDFSAGFQLTERIDLTFEALNLTDDYQDRWTDLETLRRYEYDHTGRVFKLGMRYQQ